RTDDLAERLALRILRVVVHDVPDRAVDAVLLAASGLGAELLHAVRVTPCVPRDIPAVRLEADVHPAALALPAPVGGLLPVPVDLREDVGGHEEVAVELVAALDELAVARVEQVLFLQPLRTQAERRA